MIRRSSGSTRSRSPPRAASARRTQSTSSCTGARPASSAWSGSACAPAAARLRKAFNRFVRPKRASSARCASPSATRTCPASSRSRSRYRAQCGESRYHDPASLDAESYALDYRFTSNGVVDGGPSLREFYRKAAVLTAFVEPGETKSFPLEVRPGFLFFTSGPVVEVRKDLAGPNPSVAFAHNDNPSEAPEFAVAPGPLEFVFTNPSAKRVPLLGINVPGHYQLRLENYLSGARLLSHQTFLDLFPSETIVSAEALGVTDHRAALHRHHGLDGVVRAHRRREGVPAGPAALRLAAGRRHASLRRSWSRRSATR